MAAEVIPTIAVLQIELNISRFNFRTVPNKQMITASETLLHKNKVR